MNAKIDINKHKILLVAKSLYIIFLIWSVFYIRDILNTQTFSVIEESKEKEPAVKIKDVNVKLVVNTHKNNYVYETKIRNVDSVMDLLKDLRKNQDFYFEYDNYHYGIEIINVLNNQAPPGKRWAVFKNEEDITRSINKTQIKEKGTYEIKLIDS